MPSRRTKSRYWAVDFDRCLGNVDVLFAHYVAVLNDHRLIAPKEVIAARKRVEFTKGSFDLVGFLRKAEGITDEQLALVGEEFIVRSINDPAVLMPGAERFLKYLSTNYAGRYGIVTFGNPYWQHLKIRAAGLADVPCLVVGSVHKAREIAQWYDVHDDRYHLPDVLTAKGQAGLAAGEIILVDDKKRAFDAIHTATRGYWIPGAYEMDEWVGDETRAGNRVVRIESLNEIIERERPSSA
jgi:hypothetical protein